VNSETGKKGIFRRIGCSSCVRYGCGAGISLLVFLLLVGGFSTALEATNSLEFCTSCHSMQTNFKEYKESTHYANVSGVRAECSDCHVPKKDWFAKMYRKVIAAKDVWGEMVGTIDTPEKFEAHRLEMAKREWARMKESDSIGSAIATVLPRWTSVSRRGLPRTSMPRPKVRARPASIVTRGSHTNCPDCIKEFVFPIGRHWESGVEW